MNKEDKLALHIKHSITFTSEEELVDRCLKEDRVAQHALYNKYASSMLGICNRYASHVQEAEDMMQDGFIQVFNNIGKFRFQSSLKTWITRIMINTAINYVRKHHKFQWEGELEIVSDSMEYSAEMLTSYDAKLVMKSIQQLPTGYKMVLNLFAIEGYSHKEIADMLGIQEATSRSQYAKAKASLMKELNKYGIVYKGNGAKSV